MVKVGTRAQVGFFLLYVACLSILRWKCHSRKILSRWKILQIYDIFSLSWRKQGKTFFRSCHLIFFFFIVKSDKWFCFCFSEKTREKWLAMFLRFSWEWKTFKTVFGTPWKIAKVDRKIFYSYRKTIFQSNPEKFAG